MVKNPAANAGDASDTGLIPVLERSQQEMAAYCSILAQKVPWAEEPGGLQSMGSQLVTTDHAHRR